MNTTPPAPFTSLLRERYSDMRKAAKGAHLVFLADSDGYTAYHADAVKAAPLVKQWARLLDIRADEYDAAAEHQLTIPMQHVHAALSAMRERYSIALVERVQRAPGEYGGKMAAVWVVERVESPEREETLEDLFYLF